MKATWQELTKRLNDITASEHWPVNILRVGDTICMEDNERIILTEDMLKQYLLERYLRETHENGSR